jgi:hypothetical protein
MKIKIVLLVLFIVVTKAAFAGNYADTNVWGPSIFGVKMSVAITNTEIDLKSSVVLHCQIQNLSTNIVSMQDTGSDRYDFDVSLMDYSGKKYDVGPKDRKARPIFMNTMIGINPGEIHKCDIPVDFDSISRSTIAPGTYYFRATRWIKIQKKSYFLISNDLKINVQ